MKWYNVRQPSVEWAKLRCGRVTASRFDMILTPAQGKPSSQQDTLINELLEERFSLIPPERLEAQTSKAMQFGIDTEDEARRHYAMINGYGLVEHASEDDDRLRIAYHGSTGLYVFPGGFCEENEGRYGCSPDGMIGEPMDVDGAIGVKRFAGCLELKCPRGKTQAGYLLAGILPPEYRWQTNGHLLVTGLPWCDFYSYSPGFAPLSLRVEPSKDTETLRLALEEFDARFQVTLARMKEMQ